MLWLSTDNANVLRDAIRTPGTGDLFPPHCSPEDDLEPKP